MPQKTEEHLAPSILAIIVVYKRRPTDSESLASLVEIVKTHPELTGHFSLIIYDNSPEPQPFESALPFMVQYRHDPSNRGLATAYNYALAVAESNQQDWLLLIDQDTVLTAEFLTELLKCTADLDDQQQIASIVPKLVGKGKIHSPSADFVTQMRRQYRRSGHAVTSNAVGVQSDRLDAYNSGTTLRVSALRSIRGFPEEFWLDYLDHAVFHTLRAAKFRMYIMRATLQHDHSQENLNMVPLWRQRNILTAQSLFMMRAGNVVDRFLYRIWLLRYSRRLRNMYHDQRLWKETFQQALFWKTPKDPRA